LLSREVKAAQIPLNFPELKRSLDEKQRTENKIFQQPTVCCESQLVL
jgi:hypothetical protein